jgi:hypothetical protein
MADEERTHQHAGSPAPAPNESLGREWAYLGAAVGAAVSEAANVSHSYVPPTHAPPHWTPPFGSVVGAAFWPFALLVAIEVFARVRWPDGMRWTLVRFGGLLPVAAVAAVVSYRHMSGLLGHYGEDGLTATIGPLAVDGLMVMATGALIATAAPRRAILEAPEPVRVPVEAPVPVKPAAKPVRPRSRKSGKVVKTDEELIPALRQLITETGGVPGMRRMATILGVAERRLPGLLDQVNGTQVP